MSLLILIFLFSTVSLIAGFGFFGGGDGYFNFDFGDDSGNGRRNARNGQSHEKPKKPICPNPLKPYLCQVSKLIAIAYGIGDTCVAHPRDCPCPIPEEHKCLLGKDAYICIRKDLPCPPTESK